MSLFDPLKHHRRSIRLKGYDYALHGAYFLTLVTHNRECLFAQWENDEIQKNDAGRMLEKWWHELAHKFPSIQTDEFIIMPNHFHGIIVITPVGADLRVCPDPDLRVCPDPDLRVTPDPDLRVTPDPDMRITPDPDMRITPDATPGAHAGAPLPEIVQWFKTMTTNAYIQGVKQLAWPPFAGKLWQRNYYEHIIRNESDLNRIRKYILDNPQSWQMDDENPVSG